MLDRASVNAFTADLLETGAEPATARARQLALRRFSAWLLDEGETDADHLLGLKAPELDATVVEPLTPEQMKALVAACAGKDMRDRRDEALVRSMIETGARAGEVVALGTEYVDLSTGTPRTPRQGRSRPDGPLRARQALRALDRYLRARRSHRLADTPALWLGDPVRRFSHGALHKTLSERAHAAGMEGFRPHRLRHTTAHRWLAAGGGEGGLMAVAGWTRPDMLLRYTRAQVSARAVAEARAGALRLLTAASSGLGLDTWRGVGRRSTS